MTKYDFNPLAEDEFIVLDIETTGLSPDKGGRIIELGAVKIKKDGTLLDSYKSFFNPKMKISKKSVSLTGITDEMVKDAPSLWHELPNISEFIGDTPVVCHNLKFDWDRFLLPSFREIGIIKKNIAIDSLKLARLTFKDEKSHKLADLCSYCEVPMRTAHRAYDDAYMTAECLVKMIELNKDNIPEKTNTPIEVISEEIPEVVVKRVSYWEGYGYHRQYINLMYNNNFLKIYFDIDDEYFKLNQEFSEEIFGCHLDWHIIQEKILKYIDGDIQKLKDRR